jgi:isocitrate lyase
MFQLDDKFLQDVGLGNLPEEQKKAFLDHFREQLELRVGTRLSEGLSDAQLEEFESFIDRKEDRVNAWLLGNVPTYTEDAIYQQLKAGAPANIPEAIIKAEYASLKWLGLNRPDYRQVVSSTMEELKAEIIANRDAILGNDAPQRLAN